MRPELKMLSLGPFLLAMGLIAVPAHAQVTPPVPEAAEPPAESASAPDATELAKKLANPVAALISVPFQYNADFDAGPTEDGVQHRLNIQPVVPISLSADWNVISRTILPVLAQNDVIGTSSQGGLGDTVQSLFLSPKAPTGGGWVWGAGPVLLVPTATDDFLGSEKWGAGPTAVLLRQKSGWTYGILANHVWSFAGNDSRADVDATFLQPFLSFTTKTHTTFVLNTESSYDWEHDQWSVPVNVTVNQLLKIGPQILQVGVGARYYADAPTGGPSWGLRCVLTLLFPK